MGEIISSEINSDEITRISSREVTRMMEISEHGNLLKKIQKINKGLNEHAIKDYWIEGTYKDATGRTLKEYQISKKGCDLIIQHSRKTTKLKKLINFLNYQKYHSKEIICIDRFEQSFSKSLAEVLKCMNIKVETQKSMFNGKYRIDFYIPQYNLAVEYDEKQHKYQKEADAQRQLEIEKELNCKFVRLDFENSDNYNVGIVLNEIIKDMVA